MAVKLFSTFTNEQRGAASKALAMAMAKTWELDREALGPENALVMSYAYRQAEEMLGELMTNAVEGRD